jgi:GNAT superfamily N-acetyltransferase
MRDAGMRIVEGSCGNPPSLVWSDWIRSAREAAFADDPPADYMHEAKLRITALLARPGCHLLLAMDETDAATIMGWAAIERPSRCHYVYVKHAFRRRGIARRLLAGLLPPIIGSYAPRITPALVMRGHSLVFNPEVLP